VDREHMRLVLGVSVRYTLGLYKLRNGAMLFELYRPKFAQRT